MEFQKDLLNKHDMFFLAAAVACTLGSCSPQTLPTTLPTTLPAGGETMRVSISETSESQDLHDVPLEQYVAGVLDQEVHENWPLEALKAQAVAARTYALFRKDNPRHADFDVTADTNDQVFRKKSTYAPSIVRAVMETQGQVLTFDGKIFQAFFHSCCGGRSERADHVWRDVRGVTDPPLLQIHDDPYCKSCPPAHWHYTLKAKDLTALLNASGFKVEPHSFFAAGAREESGRAAEVLATSTHSRLIIPATDLRRIVGYDKIKSTFFEIKTSPAGEVRFEGRGAGHGVGLCQWGAKAMAEDGNSYQTILNFYYPGALVTKEEETTRFVKAKPFPTENLPELPSELFRDIPHK